MQPITLFLILNDSTQAAFDFLTRYVRGAPININMAITPTAARVIAIRAPFDRLFSLYLTDVGKCNLRSVPARVDDDKVFFTRFADIPEVQINYVTPEIGKLQGTKRKQRHSIISGGLVSACL